MYICHECGNEFEKPKIIKEKHSLSALPFETVCVCPKCASTNYQKLKPNFCRCCGAQLSNSQNEYCSIICKKRGEKLRLRELGRKNTMLQNPIFKIVREKDAYNQKYGTNLSYGQFVALQASKKNRRQKNG